MIQFANNRFIIQNKEKGFPHYLSNKRSIGVLKKCLLILVLCGFSICHFAQMETEPNDLFVTANTITLPGSVSGTINSTDVDYFVFTPTSCGAITISMSGITVASNLLVRAYSAASTAAQIAQMTYNVQTPTTLNIICGGAPVYILVDQTGSTNIGTYILNIATDNSDIYECNNTEATATPLGINSSIQMKLWGYTCDGTPDTDWFKTTATQCGVLTITASGIGGGSSTTQDIRFTVYQPTVATQIGAPYWVNNSTQVSRSYLVTAGDVYIKIDDNGSDDLSNVPFTLTLSFDISDECECNNISDDACEVDINSTRQIKLWGYSAGDVHDVDWFKTTATQCGVLTITASGIGGGSSTTQDIRFTVYQPTVATQIGAPYWVNNSTQVSQSYLVTAGDVYIKVDDNGSDDLSNIPFTFTLSYDDSDPCECNNTFETACEKLVTDTFDFKINGINQLMYYTSNDRDFFKFCPDNCGNVNFKVISIPQGFNLGAKVYVETTNINANVPTQTATGLNPLNLNFSVVAGQCYYVMVYENGDNATSSQAMTAQVSFTPSITPPVISAATSTDLCPGQCVTLTTTATVDHHWSTGATTQSIQVCEAGIYRDTIQDALGCYGVSNPIIVTFQQPTHAEFTAVPNGDNVQFTSESINATIYLWDFGDGSSTSNLVNPNHTYILPGTYTVTLTVQGPCGEDTYEFDVTVSFVGIDEAKEGAIRIYPNPSTSLFTIETREQGAHQYYVYDQMGKLVLSGTNASQRFVLDLSHLPDGNYVLKMNDSTQVLTKMK